MVRADFARLRESGAGLRIETGGRSAGVSGRGPARSTSAAFSLQAERGAEAPARTAPPSALAGLDALLALQAVQDPLLARKKAVRRGRTLLDGLEALRAGLLAGQVGEGHLNRLLATLSQAREDSAPGLDALIDDIEMRVRVELAKLGVFP
jgi:hypothetical protein